ncbi:hypothetical protein ACHAPX_002814 [Trichoderma viride]
MSAPPRRSARLAKSNTGPELLIEPELTKQFDRAEPATSATPKKRIPVASPATPSTYALKPPSTEMHPSKFHATTAEPSSALRLGFTDITAARKRDSSHGAGLQSTPTKVGGVPSSAFTLRVPHGGDYLGLGPEALRVLEGLKEKAAEYKADIVAQRANESTSASTDAKSRTIATPKGKSGRFSAVHMAEFKKMDSIEGHASAWRAQNGRFQPVITPGVKRSLSKANLETAQTGLKRTPSKLEAGPQSSVTKRFASATKSASQLPSKKLNFKARASEEQSSAKDEQHSLSSKRFKKTAEDDASTTRPVVQESTSLARPASSVKRPATSRIARPSLSRLMSPTKSSLANATSPKKSEMPVAALSPKPTFKSRLEALKESRGLKQSTESKESTISKGFEGLKELEKPKELKTLDEIKALKESKITDDTVVSQPDTPLRRSVIKSVFGSSLFTPRRQSAIPQPVVTPPRFANLNVHRLAATQPVKKVVKHVTFTPEVTRTIFDPDSLTLYKTSAIKKILTRSEAKEALAEQDSGSIAYPDLSAYKDLLDAEPESAKSPTPTPSVPGKFTFRSDHTIRFGHPSPIGFGASHGQSSVRQVRTSTKPISDMPGSFPDPVSPTSHPDKENAAPSSPKVLSGVPHGMSNKKRHRAGSVDEDTDKEAADRAGKKAKGSHVPEGQALLAPRLASTPSVGAKKPTMTRSVGKTPVRPIHRAVHSVSPSRKRPTLSMSRLNMLAQPKNRG